MKKRKTLPRMSLIAAVFLSVIAIGIISFNFTPTITGNVIADKFNGDRTVTLIGEPISGQDAKFEINIPQNPHQIYVLLFAWGDQPGITLPDSRILYLNSDNLFFLSLNTPDAVGLENSIGTLDEKGRAIVEWEIPNLQQQKKVYVAAITLDETNSIDTITKPFPIRVY